MAIADKIKLSREHFGISQAELAKRSGLSEISIRKYEKGDRTPKAETLRRIAKALEVPLSELSNGRFFDIEEFEELLGNSNNDLAKSTMAQNKLLEGFPRTREEGRKKKKQILLEQYDLLNDEGQTAAVEAVENLTYNPKYAKEVK